MLLRTDVVVVWGAIFEMHCKRLLSNEPSNLVYITEEKSIKYEKFNKINKKA